MDSDAHEELLQRLRDSDATDEEIADAASAYLEHLFDIEHLHLAAFHAAEYETFWDEEYKLDILERLWELSMETFAFQLCHRWRLYVPLHKTRHAFFRTMFPKLPHQGDPQ